mgnify:CR=1 FL=1
MRGLVAKYGDGIIEKLEVLKNQTTKYSEFEYKVLIDYYKEQVKTLHKEKGI